MRTGLMAEYFLSEGWDVQWWTSDFDHYEARVRGFGTQAVDVRPRYKIQYLESRGYSNTRSIKRLWSDAEIALKFAREARAARDLPDVIIASMPSIDLAFESVRFGRELGVPVVIDIRDLHPDIFVDTAAFLLKPIVRVATLPMRLKLAAALRGASAIWGNTDAFIDWGCRVARRDRGPDDATFPIAYEPIVLNERDEVRANAIWDTKNVFCPTQFNIVFFGALSQSFDFEPVFDAAKRLDALNTNHRFYFFGRGIQEPAVERHCNGSSNSCFLGWAHAKELQTAMARSHIGLAPYHSIPNYISNLPNKPAEYLSGGLGIATSLQTGSLCEVLNANGAGFSYSSGAELADKLANLDNDRVALAKMQLAARSTFAARFDRQIISRGMVNAVQQLINRGLDR
ncbi:glycosyltransferase involved in cell wall biosynthesis [Qipengyuania citrea]|uniref:Glycosyltransferase involved in cell wall biosynthesis n=2 Tax=Qipengyuania citrea TaxID=225971 RepID=A0ABU0ND21_9SPHN|nr:glycosyltransferase involved in cell wall biosynthesis [Qipengyuania citrea]